MFGSLWSIKPLKSLSGSDGKVFSGLIPAQFHVFYQTCPAAERPRALHLVLWHFQWRIETFAAFKQTIVLKSKTISIPFELISNVRMNLEVATRWLSKLLQSHSSLLVFRFLNWPVLSPDPALCASPAHECCSPAPRKFPARLRIRACRTDRPDQGSHEDLGGPPYRFWVLQGDPANLRGGNYKMYKPVE